jgi:hypothetical protein
MADQKKRRQLGDDHEEDVVLLKDLAPRAEVKGGAKLRFGEVGSQPGKPRSR